MTRSLRPALLPPRLAAQQLVGDGGAPDPDDERGQERAEFRWAVPREAALGGVLDSLDGGFLDCHMRLVPETGAESPTEPDPLRNAFPPKPSSRRLAANDVELRPVLLRRQDRRLPDTSPWRQLLLSAGSLRSSSAAGVPLPLGTGIELAVPPTCPAA